METYGIPLSSIYDAVPDPNWYYGGWFPREDEITIITGDGGVGKTIFVTNLMLSMAGGLDFMGRPFTGEKPRFLYIDLDMGEATLKKHLLNVSRSMGLERDDIESLEHSVAIVCDGWEGIPRGYELGQPGGLDILKTAIDSANPDICIVESWSDLCGVKVDMDSNNAVNSALRSLRNINPGMSWWLIHHEGKSQHTQAKTRKKVQHRGIGAQALTKSASRNLGISRVNRKEGGMSVNVVEWGKVRLGEMPKDFEYGFGAGPDGVFRMEYIGEVE